MINALSLLPATIKAVAPRADAVAWSTALAPSMRAGGITTANRIAMFVGQVAEESNGFQTLAEDLHYSTARRIMDVWPSHFVSLSDAAELVGRPAALANRVYASRMGNGDEESGDGWKFRGRGLIQLTGRRLYTRFGAVESRASGDPDWLLTTSGAAASACWFWTLQDVSPSLNALADAWDITKATRRINGGLGNLAARVKACEAARSIFAASDEAAKMDMPNPANANPPMPAPAGPPAT